MSDKVHTNYKEGEGFLNKLKELYSDNYKILLEKVIDIKTRIFTIMIYNDDYSPTRVDIHSVRVMKLPNYAEEDYDYSIDNKQEFERIETKEGLTKLLKETMTNIDKMNNDGLKKAGEIFYGGKHIDILEEDKVNISYDKKDIEEFLKDFKVNDKVIVSQKRGELYCSRSKSETPIEVG